MLFQHNIMKQLQTNFKCQKIFKVDIQPFYSPPEADESNTDDTE